VRAHTRGSQPLTPQLDSNYSAQRPHTTVGRGRNRALRYKFLKHLLEGEGEHDELELELKAIEEREVSARRDSISGDGRRSMPERLSSRALLDTARTESQAEPQTDTPDTGDNEEDTQPKTRRRGLWRRISLHTIQQFGRQSADEPPSEGRGSVTASAESKGAFSALVNRIRKKSRVRKGPAEAPDIDLLATMAAMDDLTDKEPVGIVAIFLRGGKGPSPPPLDITF
jgi:hypothetical protein